MQRMQHHVSNLTSVLYGVWYFNIKCHRTILNCALNCMFTQGFLLKFYQCFVIFLHNKFKKKKYFCIHSLNQWSCICLFDRCVSVCVVHHEWMWPLENFPPLFVDRPDTQAAINHSFIGPRSACHWMKNWPAAEAAKDNMTGAQSQRSISRLLHKNSGRTWH
jgi:hypothetical protein